jgi:uncharacterized membrane protein YgaE (UPF0421/DUF939 family)
MDSALNRRAIACALAALGAALGFSVPIIGPIVILLIVLVAIAAVFDISGLAEAVFAPFQILASWLDKKDAFTWVRRAPFVGLIAGTAARWLINQSPSLGG